MWNWIKKLFRPWNLVKQEEKPDYSSMTKSDLKKLVAQGKIKDIYNPNK
jgi:hypothetical protein|tara:strand:- start:1405 stop:1551 length:147 start_codon:yes stop_codon:yes gene_type:complete